VLDLSIFWSVVTVGVFAACAAAHEWARTATPMTAVAETATAADTVGDPSPPSAGDREAELLCREDLQHNLGERVNPEQGRAPRSPMVTAGEAYRHAAIGGRD